MSWSDDTWVLGRPALAHIDFICFPSWLIGIPKTSFLRLLSWNHPVEVEEKIHLKSQAQETASSGQTRHRLTRASRSPWRRRWRPACKIFAKPWMVAMQELVVHWLCCFCFFYKRCFDMLVVFRKTGELVCCPWWHQWVTEMFKTLLRHCGHSSCSVTLSSMLDSDLHQESLSTKVTPKRSHLLFSRSRLSWMTLGLFIYIFNVLGFGLHMYHREQLEDASRSFWLGHLYFEEVKMDFKPPMSQLKDLLQMVCREADPFVSLES